MNQNKVIELLDEAAALIARRQASETAIHSYKLMFARMIREYQKSEPKK